MSQPARANKTDQLLHACGTWILYDWLPVAGSLAIIIITRVASGFTAQIKQEVYSGATKVPPGQVSDQRSLEPGPQLAVTAPKADTRTRYGTAQKTMAAHGPPTSPHVLLGGYQTKLLCEIPKGLGLANRSKQV